MTDYLTPPKIRLTRWGDRTPPDAVRGISSDHVAQVDGLIVAVVRLDPGAQVPLHRHEHHDEVFDVLAGQGEILIGESWQPLNYGTSALVEAGAWHALRNPGPEPLVLRETIRQRVYARAALLAAFQKRWQRWRAPHRRKASSPFLEPGL